MEIIRKKSALIDSNTFILKKDNNCIIIDCGLNPEELIKTVGKMNVVAILLTHGHFDHSFYLESYQRFFKCPVIASKNAEETLKNPSLSYAEVEFNNFDKFIYFNKYKKIIIENFVIECFHTPGHSNCSACFLIEENLFAGDTVFFSGIGRYDLANGSKDLIIKSLKKILSINFSHLHSGHYHTTTKEEQIKNLAKYLK